MELPGCGLDRMGRTRTRRTTNVDEREFERERRGGHGGYDLDDDDDGKPVALFELRRMRFVVWDRRIGGLICFKIAKSYTE